MLKKSESNGWGLQVFRSKGSVSKGFGVHGFAARE